jgi:hypothetical protein
VNYVVRLGIVPPRGMVSIEVKDEVFSTYTSVGFTTVDRIEQRLRKIYHRNDANEQIRQILERLKASGGHVLDFDPRHFKSYEEFRKFWQAGIPMEEGERT